MPNIQDIAQDAVDLVISGGNSATFREQSYEVNNLSEVIRPNDAELDIRNFLSSYRMSFKHAIQAYQDLAVFTGYVLEYLDALSEEDRELFYERALMSENGLKQSLNNYERYVEVFQEDLDNLSEYMTTLSV